MEVESERLVLQRSLSISSKPRQVHVAPSCVRRDLVQEQVHLQLRVGSTPELALNDIRRQRRDQDAAEHGAGAVVHQPQKVLENSRDTCNGKRTAHRLLASARFRYSSRLSCLRISL